MQIYIDSRLMTTQGSVCVCVCVCGGGMGNDC